MRVLVTGGAGFIGSHVVDKLKERGDEPVVLDLLVPQVHEHLVPGEWPAYLRDDVERIQADVRDPNILRKVLPTVDAVIHLAAFVGVGQSAYEIVEYCDNNVTGTAVLLEEIARVAPNLKRLIVAGSMSSYGEGMYVDGNGNAVEGSMRDAGDLQARRFEVCGEDGQPLTPIPTPESKRLDCTSVYAMTKRDQEELTLLFGQQRRISVAVPRFFNVYGPNQSLGNPYTGVAAIFSSRIKSGMAPMIYEDGDQARDFIHVSDVADAVLGLLDRPEAGGVFNIGTGKATSISQLAKTLLELYDAEDLGLDVRGLYRAGDIRNCFADVSRLEVALGGDWNPKSLSEGMGDLIAWVNDQDESKHDHDAAHRELINEGMLL